MKAINDFINEGSCNPGTTFKLEDIKRMSKDELYSAFEEVCAAIGAFVAIKKPVPSDLEDKKTEIRKRLR